MNVAVVYESRTGTTHEAARLVAGGLQSAGATVSIAPVDDLDFTDLAQADLIVVGTWTDGLFFFGQRPGGAGKIAGNLPDIWDKRVWSFVTYAKNPGRAHQKLGEVLEAKGGRTLGASAMHRHRLPEDATTMVDAIIDHFAAT